MYLGVGLALAGASLFYESPSLAGYAALFLIIVYLFIRVYEEPTLRRTFGEEYEVYCSGVGRWLPRWSTRTPNGEPNEPPAKRPPA